ncbi:hypothetical protein J14TS5_45040 [Paenibacillus lautus]|nr:hypothetical protein J14TS5_45040 [Paenibacillus lautus]
MIKRFGEVGISAFAVVQYISLVINAVLIGMTRGLGSVISINYGANQLARIKELIILTIRVVLTVGILCVAVLLLLKSELISVFVQNNAEVTTFAEEILFFYSFNFIAAKYKRQSIIRLTFACENYCMYIRYQSFLEKTHYFKPVLAMPSINLF